MRRLLAAVKNIRKKSSQVADENMVSERGGEVRPRWTVSSFLDNIIQGPLSLFSCVTQPQVNGADGMWVSGEFGRFSDINHLVVNDGMRYVLLM
ncbi:hypothetical protein ACHQM5_025657 [Ranunculus cassubicifolius]